MTIEIKKISSAKELPCTWDELAEEYYQLREFLIHMERHNPCKQRYYLLYDIGVLKAGLVVYDLILNLFTYSFIRLPFRMNIAGIPCSVSASGFIGDDQLMEQLLDFVKQTEKGFLLVLNLDSKPCIKDMMIGRTLPTVILHHNFTSWNAYLNSLRADYRRRMNSIANSFQGIRTLHGDCSLFTVEMYQLYLEVLDHTKGKLETLSFSFFRELPPNFNLTAYYTQDILLGWYISVSHNQKYYFFLGGFKYENNQQYNTYLNVLNGVVQEGIDRDYHFIDLGQTAEIPKMRLGGKLADKWMLGYHSNWLLRKLIISTNGLLEYSETFPATHTFKELK